MSENSPIKDALYENIANVGEEQIHQLLLNGKFSEIFEKIGEPVIQDIKSLSSVHRTRASFPIPLSKVGWKITKLGEGLLTCWFIQMAAC